MTALGVEDEEEGASCKYIVLRCTKFMDFFELLFVYISQMNNVFFSLLSPLKKEHHF